MYFHVILLFLAVIIFLALLRGGHRLCLLEAINRSGADLLMDGEDVGFSSIIIAVLHGSIGIRLRQELDTDISITWKEFRSADTSHPPLTEDWEAVRDAALSSTRQLLGCRDPDEETPLDFFIQSVVLSTLLHLFFGLPATPANTEEVTWIVGKTWRTDDCHQDSMLSPELFQLLKSSQNPSGVFALLSTARRLILAAACTLEFRDDKIRFLRRAATLLCHPISPEPGVTRLVEKTKNTNPPVQLVHGVFRLGSFPFCGIDSEVGFLVPADLLPPSACILGPNGGCISWLHKAALPGQPGCGGEQWLIHTTTIILSAIEMEIRRARLTIDENEHGSEAWEEWILRRLRV